MSIEKFYTTGEANSGKIIPLFSPTGGATEHWVRARGVDSDIYVRACYEVQHKMIAFRAELDEQLLTKEERTKKLIEKEIELERWKAAHIVMEWSFDIAVEIEEITKHFKKAPQLQESLNTVVMRRALFFGAGLSGSLDSQETNSDSTRDEKTAKRPTEITISKSGKREGKSRQN